MLRRSDGLLRAMDAFMRLHGCVACANKTQVERSSAVPDWSGLPLCRTGLERTGIYESGLPLCRSVRHLLCV